MWGCAEADPAERESGYRRGRRELGLGERAPGALLEVVEEERREEARPIGRGLAPGGEEDEPAPRGAPREVKEETLLAGVAGSGARGDRPARGPGERGPLVVEEERVGPPRARERLLDEAGDEDDVEEEAARRDRGEERKPVSLEAPLPDGRLLERIGEEPEDVDRRDGCSRLDRLELAEARRRVRERVGAREASEERVERRREPLAPGPPRGGRRVGEDGREESDDFAERREIPPHAHLSPRDSPFRLGRLLRGAPRQARLDPRDDCGPAVAEADLEERPFHAGAGPGGKEGEAFEDVDEPDEVVGREASGREREGAERGAAGRRAGEAGAGRAEEGDLPGAELGDERGLLPRRVAHEDGDPVERDAVVDGAEDLANDLARLGELGGSDDDGDLRPLDRVGQRAGRRVEEALEEVRSRWGDSLARLFRLPVDWDERDDGPLGGDGREERLAYAAEVVKAVDEERLGPRRSRRRGASREEGVGVGERGSRLLESGQDDADLAEERGAVGRRGGGAEELRETVGREAGPTQVCGGPRDEARH